MDPAWRVAVCYRRGRRVPWPLGQYRLAESPNPLKISRVLWYPARNFSYQRQCSAVEERRTAMKGTRHSEEQIIAILKQGEAGLTTAELCRQHGISEQTYYRWKAKYGGMDSGEAKRLKQLEDENRKLKHVVAELTLDNRALKDVLSKNW